MTTEAKVSYKIIPHVENNFIEVIWSGQTTSHEFRTGNFEVLKELNKNNLQKVIMDMERLKFSVTQEDHEWIKEHYLPEAIKSNLKSIAFVEPGFFNTLSIANILYPFFPDTINFEIFDSFETASLWILKN